MKNCNICKILKKDLLFSTTEFNRKTSTCKECVSIRNKEYRSKNLEKLRKHSRDYYKKNKEKALSYLKDYRKKNKTVLAEKDKLRKKKLRETNPELLRSYSRKSGKKNRKHKNCYHKAKKKSDIQYKLKCILRDRINKALSGNYKSGSAVSDLGISIVEFKIYLENQFYINPKTGEMMTWENQGRYGWHIDHIIPLSSFDLTNRNDFLKACHYTNMQPMWQFENLQKGKKNG